jgi:hypothetical protein
MNIFCLDENPQLCAKYHCNKHVVKMITEHNQMLTTNLYILNGLSKEEINHSTFNNFPRKNADGSQNPYRIVHVNHPCTKWLRASKFNTLWLLLMNKYLCDEYLERYGKKHKGNIINNWLMQKYNSMYLFGEPHLMKHVQAMPKDVKNENAVIAYRQYYVKYKSHFAKWKDFQPEWYAQMIKNC